MKQPDINAGAALLAQTQSIKVADIVPDPNNRKDHNKARLQLLADEIAVDGLLQPVVLRPTAGGKFMLIAGERRWRAFQLLKRDEIPAIVRQGEVQKTATRKRVAENFHREDLTPIEKARDLEQLFKDGMSQPEVAEFVGAKDSSTISNMMRLLKLPKKVQDWLQDGALTAAHGKALLRFEGKNKLVESIAERAIDQGASTKALEKGLPFAEKLVEDGIVHDLEWSARTLKDLPKEYQEDPDFIVAENEYGESGVYCLDANKGKMVHERLNKERSARLSEQASKSSKGGGGGSGGGMSATEIAARKKKIAANKANRAAVGLTIAKASQLLLTTKDLPIKALTVVLDAALREGRYSEHLKDAAKMLGIVLPASRGSSGFYHELRFAHLEALKPAAAIKVAALAIVMRHGVEALRYAGPTPQSASHIAGGVVKAAEATKPAKKGGAK